MSSRRLEIVCVLALLFCSALVYLPAISYAFVADDSSQILSNIHVHSWHYIPSYFTSHVWAHIALGPGDRAAAYYRPVFLLWLLANYSLFGYGPAAWHFSVILLHVAVTLLVYLLAKRLLGEWWMAATAALFFALHPTHIEAVAWVSGASEPLMALPFLGSVLCYIETVRARRKALWLAASLLLYTLAVFAKETAIVLPAVLVGYDLLLRPPAGDGRKLRAILQRMSGYVAVTAVYWVFRSIALRGILITDVPLPTLLYTWPAAVWFYMQHLLVPLRLSFFYNLTFIPSFRTVAILVPLALAVLALGLAMAWARRSRVAAFAALWGVLLILPPLYLPAFIPFELVHDRYLYLPSIGFSVLLALAIWRARKAYGGWRVALAIVGAVALGYAALTMLQSRNWSDEAALFTHSFRVGNTNWSAQRNYAFAMSRTGHCEEAMPLLAAFVTQDATDAKATFALGSCYFHQQYWDDAERMMRLTAQLSPHYQQPFLMIAAIRLYQGRIPEAEEAWHQAVLAQGGSEELDLHFVHGEILKAKGDRQGAAAEFRKELLVQPGREAILSELGAVDGP